MSRKAARRTIAASLGIGLTASAAYAQQIHGFGLDAEPAHASPRSNLYVDVDAAGPTHDGLSWCTAFVDLQDALEVAGAGTTIRVADGTYTPDRGTGDRTATFQLINGVTIEGGDAPDPYERDIISYETIVSGDLNGNDVPNESDCCRAHEEPGCDDPACKAAECSVYPECGSSPWDEVCVFYAANLCTLSCNTNAENSHHVATGSGTDATAILDGFTVTAGNADGSDPYYFGAGLYNNLGSPTLTTCTFSNNSACYGGGGIANENNSGPTLTNCTFFNNNSAEYGGGMHNSHSSPTEINCLFSENFARWGGGIQNSYGTPTLTN